MPDGSGDQALRKHRKAIRSTAMDLHRMASDMTARRGMLPPDVPSGYVDAFAGALRQVARLAETSRGETCMVLKRRVLSSVTMHPKGTCQQRAAQQAVNALLNMLNLNASRIGLNPFL